jgi:type II secretory pathway component GspD/PulD (secretin)
MKVLLFLLMCLPVCAVAQSDTVRLEFRRLPVVEFVDAFYGTIIRQNYVITPDALANDHAISMNIDASVKQLPTLISDVLKVAGLSVRESGGIFYIDALSVDVNRADAEVDEPFAKPRKIGF